MELAAPYMGQKLPTGKSPATTAADDEDSGFMDMMNALG